MIERIESFEFVDSIDSIENHLSLLQKPRGMGVPPMKHGQDARATCAYKGFARGSLHTPRQERQAVPVAARRSHRVAA